MLQHFYANDFQWCRRICLMKFMPSKRRVSQCDSDSPSEFGTSRATWPPWAPWFMGAHRNSTRFSAHRKYLCRSLRLCASGDLVEHFHLWTRRKKKEKKEEGQTRPGRQRGGRNRAHIIMDPAIEKSETSRREVHERIACTYVSTNTYAYVHANECGGPPARDVLFRSATDGPRRLPFSDYKCVWDTCITFIHYHLPFSNRDYA